MGTSTKGNKMTRGNAFVFPAEQGFSGSCGGTPVKGYMRGGIVKPAAKSYPGKSPAKATGKAYAEGGSIRPSDKERKDYDDSKASSEPVYPEVGTAAKPFGYAKGGGNFIKGAIKRPGALHRKLHVPQGKKIPAGKISKAAKAPGLLGKEARFAETLKGLRHAKGGEIKESEEHEDAKGGFVKKAKGGCSTPKPYAYGGRMPGAVAGAKHRGHTGRGGRGSPMVSGVAKNVMMAPPPMPMGAPTGSPLQGGGGMAPPATPTMAKGGKR